MSERAGDPLGVDISRHKPKGVRRARWTQTEMARFRRRSLYNLPRSVSRRLPFQPPRVGEGYGGRHWTDERRKRACRGAEEDGEEGRRAEGSRVTAHGCRGPDAARVRCGVSWFGVNQFRLEPLPARFPPCSPSGNSSILTPATKISHPAQLNVSSPAPPLQRRLAPSTSPLRISTPRRPTQGQHLSSLWLRGAVTVRPWQRRGLTSRQRFTPSTRELPSER